MRLNTAEWIANSKDPDETPSTASDHGLLKPACPARNHAYINLTPLNPSFI